jgi:hypothetical protein
MLIKLRFRFPEVFFGALLVIAIFAMGWILGASRHQPANSPTNSAAQQIQPSHKPEPFTLDWLTHDGAVFFTAVLCSIAGVQAALFIWQLVYMNKGLRDARMAATAAGAAAGAAQQSANHLRAAERAHIFGGIGGHMILDVESVDGPYVFANLNNLGKTPGFVTRIAVAVRPLAGLPEEPEYPEGIKPGFMLGPNETRFPAPAANAWNGGLGRRVFYGRIWYEDMFDRSTQHFSSFALDLDTGYGILDRPKYWEWT